VKGLNSFQTNHNGPYGRIQSNWKRVKNTVIYEVIVPANSTATLKLSGKKISQNGKVIAENSGKKVDQSITLDLESGKNEFIVVQ
jgi:alpha-L-rhamnosidase